MGERLGEPELSVGESEWIEGCLDGNIVGLLVGEELGGVEGAPVE